MFHLLKEAEETVKACDMNAIELLQQQFGDAMSPEQMLLVAMF